MNIGDFKVNTNGWNENPDRLFFNDRPQAERAAIPAVDVRGAGPMPSISRTLKGVLPPDVRVVGKKIRKLSYWIFNVHRWENASFEIEGQFPRHGCDRWLEIENEGWGAFLSRRSKLHFYGAVILAIMRVFNRALRQGGRRYAIANEIPNSCLELPDNPAYPGDREGALEFLFGKFAKARRHAVEVPDLSKRLPVSFQGDRGYTAEKRKAIWRIEIRLGNRKIPSLTDRRGNPLTGRRGYRG